jgi:aspartate aminotransferase-like enzyme
LYLDLNTYYDEQDRGGTPFTQSVQTFYALNRGFVICSGQGSFAKSIFRVSTMGEITFGDIDRLLAGVALLTVGYDRWITPGLDRISF